MPYSKEFIEQFYATWVGMGKPRPCPPDMFERVLYRNTEADAIINWYEQMIEYVKTVNA